MTNQENLYSYILSSLIFSRQNRKITPFLRKAALEKSSTEKEAEIDYNKGISKTLGNISADMYHQEMY